MGKYTDAVLPQELHFGLAMLGTFFVSSSIGTVVLFGFVGFSWAASAWIPYALVDAEVSPGYFTTHAYEAVTIDESQVGDGDEGNGPEDSDDSGNGTRVPAFWEE
ncbi:hypothetical protein DTO271D3_3220 [Paecilomyces variotii]|nr:hypothetical protein DTO271D3_3220 [Paecilomyces variotii]KAJ9356141.1 hypothetical protein DTO027B9_3683 [Paecilomyces variotii]